MERPSPKVLMTRVGGMAVSISVSVQCGWEECMLWFYCPG